MGGTWDRKCSETGTLLLSASPTAGSFLCRLAFFTLIFMKQISAASAGTTRPTTGLMFQSQFPGGSDGPAWVRWPLLSQPAVAVGVTWHLPVVRPIPYAGCGVMGTLEVSTLPHQCGPGPTGSICISGQLPCNAEPQAPITPDESESTF